MCSMKLISLKRMLFLVLPWNYFWLNELQRASLFHNVHAAHSWAWSSYFLPVLSLPFAPFLSLVSLSLPPSFVLPFLPLLCNLKKIMDPYHTQSKMVNVSASFLGGRQLLLTAGASSSGFLMGITYAFVFNFLQLYFCLDVALLEQKAFLIFRVFYSLLLISGYLVMQSILKGSSVLCLHF